MIEIAKKDDAPCVEDIVKKTGLNPDVVGNAIRRLGTRVAEDLIVSICELDPKELKDFWGASFGLQIEVLTGVKNFEDIKKKLASVLASIKSQKIHSDRKPDWGDIESAEIVEQANGKTTTEFERMKYWCSEDVVEQSELVSNKAVQKLFTMLREKNLKVADLPTAFRPAAEFLKTLNKLPLPVVEKIWGHSQEFGKDVAKLYETFGEYKPIIVGLYESFLDDKEDSPEQVAKKAEAEDKFKLFFELGKDDRAELSQIGRRCVYEVFELPAENIDDLRANVAKVWDEKGEWFAQNGCYPGEA